MGAMALSAVGLAKRYGRMVALDGLEMRNLAIACREDHCAGHDR
jgi:hypothetical protein